MKDVAWPFHVADTLHCIFGGVELHLVYHAADVQDHGI